MAPTITEETVVRDADTGHAVFAYLNVAPVTDLRAALLGIPDFATKKRTSGLVGDSKTFGAAPRRPIYGREGCLLAQLSTDRPRVHEVLVRWASALSDRLAEVEPGVVTHARDVTAEVKPDWRLGDTHWTSGVINRTSVLPYHRDTSNFPVWSAMPVVRRGVTGGHLHLPEYDVAVPCRDGWCVMFPGHQLVHGVTPIRVVAKDGYRFSVVFYALRGVKDCYTSAEETLYARRRRTKREQDMADRLGKGEPAPINDYRDAGTVTRGNVAGTRTSRRNRPVVSLCGPRPWSAE
jgi:hypothetical protein